MKIEAIGPIEDISGFQPVEHMSRDNMRKQANRRLEAYYLPLDRIIIEPGYNARIPGPDLEAHVEYLASQIAEHGYDSTKPLTGFFNPEGMFVVTDGHCRRIATGLAVDRGAPITEVPCFPEEKSFNDEDRALALIFRNEGKPLQPLEIAVVIRRLQKFGWDTQKIAQELKKSITYVENMLTLSAAPVQVREMVSAGQVSSTLAISTIKSEGTAQAVETLTTAVEEAEASGKGKATAKTVKSVQEKREASVGEEGGFDDGGAPAKGKAGKPAAVKAKVPVKASSDGIDWNHWGPRLHGMLKAIHVAKGDELLQLCIEQSKDLVKDLKNSVDVKILEDDRQFAMFSEE